MCESTEGVTRGNDPVQAAVEFEHEAEHEHEHDRLIPLIDNGERSFILDNDRYREAQ